MAFTITFCFPAEQESVKSSPETTKSKLAQLAKVMSAFSRQQIEALHVILSMPAAERQAVLRMYMAPQSPQLTPQVHTTPQPPQHTTPQQQSRLRRRISLGSSASSRHSADDNASVSSSSSRVRHKDDAKDLAAFLVKQYFASPALWKHLYNKDNRIENSRLIACMEQVEKTLSKEQQSTLKEHKDLVLKHLKKKIAAARNYRRSEKGKKNRKKLISPMAHMIDLTHASDNEDNGAGDDGGDKHDDNGAGDDGGDKHDDNGAGEDGADEDGAEKRVSLAKNFVNRMNKIRGSRVKVKKKKSKGKSGPKKPNAKSSDTTTPKAPSETKSKGKSGSKKPNVKTRSSTRRSRKRSQSDDGVSTPKKKHKPSLDVASPGNKWKDRRLLSVGDRISGKWNQDDEHNGEWYDGVVKSIDRKNETVHVLFDDGDEDDELKWTDLRIID